MRLSFAVKCIAAVLIRRATLKTSGAMAWILPKGYRPHRHRWRHSRRRSSRISLVFNGTTGRSQGELLPRCSSSANEAEVTIVSNDAATLRSITFANLPTTTIGDAPDASLLCDLLLELGACSVSVTDAHAGTEKERPIFDEPHGAAADEVWQDSLHPAAPLWDVCDVTAHLPASVDLSQMLDIVRDCLVDDDDDNDSVAGEDDWKFIASPQVTTIPDNDWVARVQRGWPPLRIGKSFVLRFPWHTDKQVAAVVGGHSVHEVCLQGGVAFGTGEHPTTRLCLEWIEQMLLAPGNCMGTANDTIRVMDYGCGSGILGLAACLLQSNRVRAIGLDVDVDAVAIAIQNAAINNVPLQAYLPPFIHGADDESKSLLLKSHQHAQKQLHQREQEDSGIRAFKLNMLPDDCQGPIYDMVVANILAGPLSTLASTLADLMKPGGVLGLSGILAAQCNDVCGAYRDAGLVDVKQLRESEGWVLISTRKPQ